ncbi:MAG: condensation domain-containing protein [Desulfovibrio sp.]|uniref:non-ribosomal peptide synthetase n=1 Tax=Desulfovibrio sp. TaxID=885 RepID=UPI0039E291BE
MITAVNTASVTPDEALPEETFSGMADSLESLDIAQLAQLLREADTQSPSAPEDGMESIHAIRADPPRLSLAQERLWFMDQLAPGNPFYNIPFAFRLGGTIDVELFQRAWLAVMERHAALRINIRPDTKGKISVITRPHTQYILGFRSAPSFSLVQQAMRHEAEKGFNLTSDLLIRGCLFRETDDSHVLLFTAHHIVFDGWSIGIFLQDLMQAYTDLARNTVPEWEPLLVTYEQYAVWHRDRVLRSAESESLWWRERLANLPDLALPTDFPRPAAQSFKGSMHQFVVPREIVDGIESLAAQENTTPYAVWLTIFSMAVSRFSAQRDFAVGSSFAGRSHAAIEPLVGFFVENLSIRIQTDPQQSLRALIQTVQRAILETLEHADLPFQMLTEALGRQRDLSRNPIYQTAFTYQNMLSGDMGFDGISIENLPMPSCSTHMDMEILAWPGASGLDCTLLYASDLFRPETMHGFAKMFTALAREAAQGKSALDAPSARFGFNTAVSLTHGAARAHHAIAPWKTFTELCNAMPEATAVVSVAKPGTSAAEYRMTRHELLNAADSLASHLAAQGVKPGSSVLLRLEQGPELLAAILAVWKLGAVWTPLAPGYPESLARWIASDCGAVCILTADSAWKVDGPAVLNIRELPAEMGGQVAPQSPYYPEKEDTACLLYTSGSTGNPKGVRLSYAAIANRLRWMWEQFPWGASEACCQKTSPVFVDFIWEALGPLLSGIPLLSLPDGSAADVPWLLDQLERHKTTRLVLVPSLLAEMHRTGLAGRLPALRILTASGEILPPDIASATLKALPSIRLLNLYGSTEVTGDATFYEVTGQEKGAVPIGAPVHNTTLAVVDEQGSILPAGAVGRLFVAGGCLASGYHGAAATFSSAWVDEQRHEGMTDEDFQDLCRVGGHRRWFNTGDMIRLDTSGIAHYYGRIDRQIKIRGIRIEPEEIQTVLEAHPLVEEARVLAVSGPSGGDAAVWTEQRLAAYVIPGREDASSETADGSRARCLNQWESLYDSMYTSVRREGQILDNFLIWESSYTGQKIPTDEMREWLAASLAAIHEHAPRSVLEVGCGQGFLLMDLVRTCERYVGLDISAQALACLKDILPGGEHPSTSGTDDIKAKILLAQSSATELPPLEAIGGKAFDTAIFNSVLQYFPDREYCVEAVRQAVERLDRGGRVILGDIRNFDSLDMLHTAIQIYRCDGKNTARELLDRANSRKRMESELLLSPAFWHALPRLIPRICHVEVRPKRGHSHNELTEFRYEAVLYCDHNPFRPFFGPVLSWGDTGAASAEDLQALLTTLRQEASSGEQAFGVSGIPHARLAVYQAVRQLAEESCLSGMQTNLDSLLGEAQALKETNQTVRGLNPEDIHAMAESHGLEAAISIDLRDGVSFNVLFHTPGSAPCLNIPWPGAEDALNRPLAYLANAPASSRDETMLRSHLRDYLKEHLSPAMVPDVILTVPQWPRTPSGKIDWKRLPSPNMRLFASTSGMQLPATPEETRIADIWKLVIGLDEVSIHDNFFEIGGTSLLLTQVHQMIQSDLGKTFPLSTLFQYPTIHALTEWMHAPETPPGKNDAPPNARESRMERQRLSGERRARRQSPNATSL